jgi:hypothetical protein
MKLNPKPVEVMSPKKSVASPMKSPKKPVASPPKKQQSIANLYKSQPPVRATTPKPLWKRSKSALCIGIGYSRSTAVAIG